MRINIDTSKNLQKRNVKLSERTVRLNQTHLNLFRRELQTTPNHRFKNLPKYQQQTNKSHYNKFLIPNHDHIIKLRYLSLSLSQNQKRRDDLTPRKLRTEASSQRPRSFATSDSKWDSSRTTIGSSALPSFTTTGRVPSTATSLAAAGRVRRPPFMVSYERENKKVLERERKSYSGRLRERQRERWRSCVWVCIVWGFSRLNHFYHGSEIVVKFGLALHSFSLGLN